LNPPEPLSTQALRAKAIAALARREHSRQELLRRLGPLAESAEQLHQILDHLEQEGLLSDQRFADSMARVRGARYGAARIRFDLRAKGVEEVIIQAKLKELISSELDRAHQVWQRKFGEPPTCAQERARQHRFLMQRGFSADVISRVMRAVQQRGT
jgi:regulatory protein